MIGNRIPMALALLAVLGVLGACSAGGSGADSGVAPAGELTAEEKRTFEREVSYAQCMRANGIDGLPEPQLSGTDFMVVAYPFAAGAEAWTTADEACQSVRDGASSSEGAGAGGGATGAVPARELTAEEAAELEAEVAFAECMRGRGVEGLPDPQSSGDGFILVGVPLSPDAEEWNEAQESCVGAQGDVALPGAAWDQVAPGDDCRCADGSEFSFWVHEADPTSVVFFLQDGGACWSAETCAPERGRYNTSAEGPPADNGIFDFADTRNPFAGHSFVYVPYCTADVHIGDATTQYTSELTVHHNGYVNATAALDHLVGAFPGATEIVVLGESAGSVAAPLYAGLASERIPDATITVLADGSGSFPDVAAITRPLDEAWGTGDTIPNWALGAASSAERWSIPGLFIRSSQYDPDIVFARHDYAYDDVQREVLERVDVPAGDLLTLIDANETLIEGAGVELFSYVAPGNDHTVLSDGRFYRSEVNGQPLVDWVSRIVDRAPVDDVHCITCR